MERIVSRTSTERILRTGIATVLVCGYSAWSLWDGFVGYPRKNVATAWREKLALPATASLPGPDARISPDEVERVRVGVAIESLPPWFRAPGFENDESQIFFGPAGYLAVRTADGRVTQSIWTDGPRHRSADLAFQKIVGFVLAPVGLVMMGFLLRVCTFRVELDERGLRIRGGRSVPYGSMTELREVGPPGRGLQELSWRTRGTARRFRFDGYTVRHAERLVRALQERMGAPDPAKPSVVEAPREC